MKIETRKEDSAVVVAPSGRLDRAGARALEAKLYAAARQGGGRAVLDCGGIAYISCAGLRALLLGAKACVQEGGELAVAALRPECRALLEASGLLSVLQYHETAEAALNGTGRPRRKAVRDGMEIGERREAHAVVLSLVGQLNGDGASLLLARIANAIEHGIFRVALDCTGMSYVNSAGLRALPDRRRCPDPGVPTGRLRLPQHADDRARRRSAVDAGLDYPARRRVLEERSAGAEPRPRHALSPRPQGDSAEASRAAGRGAVAATDPGREASTGPDR